jgi:hypothetical protein
MLRLEDLEFEVSLGYRETLSPEQKRGVGGSQFRNSSSAPILEVSRLEAFKAFHIHLWDFLSTSQCLI